MISRSLLLTLSLLLLLSATAGAQEFPIATGPENTFAGGGAFDGTNYLFTVLGDASSNYSIRLQFVSRTGALVGQPISLGRYGSSPMAVFDGTNFLIAWTDSFPSFTFSDSNGIGNVYGQFVSPAGTSVGGLDTFAVGVNIKWGKGRGNVVFNGSEYLLTYHKGFDHHTDYLFAQRISTTGQLIGGPVQVSDHYAREHAVAFDGTNYLLAWCRTEHPLPDKYIYGRFLSGSGTLPGSTFMIDAGEQPSDNPVTMIFDGIRYWVAFHEQAYDTTGRWNIFARFVSTAGTVSERVMVCDSSDEPTYASAACDGRNYLVAWMAFAGIPRIKGRYVSMDGQPLDTAVTLFAEQGGKFPIGGVAGFVDGHYVLGATRVDMNFGSGDMYGLFLPASPTGVSERQGPEVPIGPQILGAFPNPFNPSTRLRYIVGEWSHVRLSVLDLLGREVALLAEEMAPRGEYETQWNAEGAAGGVYLARLVTTDAQGRMRSTVAKLALIR